MRAVLKPILAACLVAAPISASAAAPMSAVPAVTADARAGADLRQASALEGSLWIIGLVAVAVLGGHTERVDSFAWQPGGEHLVSGGRDWRLALWRPGKAKQPIDVQMVDSQISVVRWSADGKRLAVGEKQGRVGIFDLVAR